MSKLAIVKLCLKQPIGRHRLDKMISGVDATVVVNEAWET